jgi:hypothetical protein
VYKALEKLSDNLQQWTFLSCREKSACIPKKGGIYELKKDIELNMKINALTKKIDALTMQNLKSVSFGWIACLTLGT